MTVYAAGKNSFDIPDLKDFVPRRLKPWIFILFVLIIQFSGGIYLAAASGMAGSKAFMQEDILMAGYASLAGMAVNFAVMFRIKFRFATRTQLLACCIVLIVSNFVCVYSESVPVLVASCFVAGWFRMQGTFACNSTIQLWITPKRDMAVFFCYVYIIVDSVIQLSGIALIYTAFCSEWQYMQWIMTGLLVIMMAMLLMMFRPVHCPMHIPLLGIDWLGSALWSIFMLCFTFVCVYGEYFDWWEAFEIRLACLTGVACVAINLFRATFLRHPYISVMALKNRNVWRASCIYLVFYTLMATEHVFEHTYEAGILGFDDTNLIDLNWYVLAGIVAGCAFTYFTFARRKWTYKTLTVIAFGLAVVYLAYFYFYIDYNIEREMLFIPLFARAAASVIISIVFLTYIVQSGLPFNVFPQALTINGFTGAVMAATLGPAVIGELLRHTVAKNISLISAAMTPTDEVIAHTPLSQLFGVVQAQALVESMKEVYGLLLIAAILSLAIFALSYSSLRPFAIFPKWKRIRNLMRLDAADTEKIGV